MIARHIAVNATPSRRQMVAGLAGLCAALPGMVRAQALAYPDRPVKIVVAFAPGGTVDTLTRIMADRLGAVWNQGVVVENRAGGGGNIGASAAAHAPADGYTLHMGVQSLSANVTLLPTPNFDPFTDLEPVIFVAFAPDVLMVGKASPFQSLADLVAAAKARPDELTFASLGVGSSGHLATTMFCDLTGIRAQHVAYTGLGQAVTDLVSGRVSFWMATIGGHLGNIRSGNVRALAVSGAQRAPTLPDVPTFQERGIALVEPSSWFALFAPKGTPRDVVAKINADANALLQDPAMREKLVDLGFALEGGDPERLGRFLRSDAQKWAKVAAAMGFEAK